jgi:multiple sugar transport system ATP-binding protein
MASITFDRITKRYPDGTQAVSELDLDVADGEFLVLVGPSGCGKTTALRMAAGLEEISAGRLLIGDRVVNDVHPSQRDIAMVFQNYALYPHMSVRENIAFPLACAGVAKAEVTSRVERAAEALGLGDLLHRRPKALSGGQRQRVAMGRAIVRQPQAFLMDEPLSNLDAKLRGQMRAEIRGLQRQYGVTTLYVTHDQVEAMTMGDRIAVMRKGLLQQLGTPDELYESPANLFVAEFIGSPPMNVVTATVTRAGGGHHLVVGSQRIVLPAGTLDRYPSLAGADATDVALGVRPESLRDPAVADPGFPRLVADVELVENLPPEKLVHLRLDAEPVVTDATVEIAQDIDAAAAEDLRSLAGNGSVLHARLPGTTAVREGSRAEFAVPPSALHFFDLSTGQAITPTQQRLAAAAR